MKQYILFDHDGVLVDTEYWYYTAGERALADIGFRLDKNQYLRDMSRGMATWAQARAAGVDEHTISRQREARNAYYREYLRNEAIEIDGVVEILAELSQYVRMAIVTTARRADFEVIHENREIVQFMDFALVREDYELAKPGAGLFRSHSPDHDTERTDEHHSRQRVIPGMSRPVRRGLARVVVMNR